MALPNPINSLKRFPNEILHQIIADVDGRPPVTLYQLITVNRFCHDVVRQHPAWCQNLYLEYTNKRALGIFNSQLVACKERKRPTDVDILLLGRHDIDVDIHKQVFVEIMAILPFIKTLRLTVRLDDPQALWQQFSSIPALQLESLDFNLINHQHGSLEALVLPAHPFSGQAPLLKYINANFDYRSPSVTPFTTVESVCWEVCQRLDAGILRGSNIAAQYPKARKLVFDEAEYGNLPLDLFSGAVGLWQLEDIEIWGVRKPALLENILSHLVTSSTRRISIDGQYTWGDPTGAGLFSSCLPLGEPLSFKALMLSEHYELFALSLSTVRMESSRTIELRGDRLMGHIGDCVHIMLMQSFSSRLASVTRLEFDLRLWNQILKSDVSFSAVHTLVIYVSKTPFWEKLHLKPDLNRLDDSGFFPLDQSTYIPLITRLEIIGTAARCVRVEETWIAQFVASCMSGFDTTASPVILRCLKLMTTSGTLEHVSGWPRLSSDDCEVVKSK
ncbi:hypothetical protein BKA62DRAFT_670226 [Auriculariales sp. MPI-PUGE-AT-0066]|nr:hypothetical protein BKA62DRAFT_670226 [Auriculariales sp. MPI-PUGE-AT-0066]